MKRISAFLILLTFFVASASLPQARRDSAELAKLLNPPQLLKRVAPIRPLRRSRPALQCFRVRTEQGEQRRARSRWRKTMAPRKWIRAM